MSAAKQAQRTPGPLPLPLRVVEQSPGRYALLGPQGRSIASVAGIGQSEAIVRACNSHDDLLAALKEAADTIERLLKSSRPERQWATTLDNYPPLQDARAAIAKAEA